MAETAKLGFLDRLAERSARTRAHASTQGAGGAVLSHATLWAANLVDAFYTVARNPVTAVTTGGAIGMIRGAAWSIAGISLLIMGGATFLVPPVGAAILLGGTALYGTGKAVKSYQGAMLKDRHVGGKIADEIIGKIGVPKAKSPEAPQQQKTSLQEGFLEPAPAAPAERVALGAHTQNEINRRAAQQVQHR